MPDMLTTVYVQYLAPLDTIVSLTPLAHALCHYTLLYKQKRPYECFLGSLLYLKHI